MKNLVGITFQLLTVSAIFPLSQLCAQHYPAGTEGIKAACMPPPGLYFKDDNSFHYSDKTPGFSGQLEANSFQKNFDLFTYVQAPRLIWMTPLKILGAEYGAALRIPLVYKKHDQENLGILRKYNGIDIGPLITSVDKFGLGDIQVEPLILAWHTKRFDFVSSYSFWAPTGEYDHHKLFLLNLGSGYWTHMFTLGLTWYPDAEKTWAFSLINRYEINMAQYSDLYVAASPQNVASLDTTLGDVYTLEWAVSKTVAKGLDVGLTGYYQQQVTATEGPTWFGPTYFDERVHVAGIGPEISFSYPKWGLAGSLRYAYEFSALDNPQGHNITLTVKIMF